MIIIQKNRNRSRNVIRVNMRRSAADLDFVLKATMVTSISEELPQNAINLKGSKMKEKHNFGKRSDKKKITKDKVYIHLCRLYGKKRN